MPNSCWNGAHQPASQPALSAADDMLRDRIYLIKPTYVTEVIHSDAADIHVDPWLESLWVPDGEEPLLASSSVVEVQVWTRDV